MCGIAGYLTARPNGGPSEFVLERMTDSLAHRGPDGVGYHRDAHASLGHRRLSIIDLATGSQPMYNEDRSAVIVYNGEVYNHRSLRPELEARGHRYASACDTETIIHAYEEYGAHSVQKLYGMFSFVIWDGRKKTLFAARDRLGIKPFYYFFDGQSFVFGSEIKALLEHPAVSRDLDKDVLPEYLAFGYVSGTRTMFRGIQQLRPGGILTLELTGDRWKLSESSYWDVPAIPDNGLRDLAAVKRECRRLLEDSVSLRLMSDVSLGMFLSGGVDSSAIAAIMKRLRDAPVETFSVGYAEGQYSELAFARDVSDHIGTEHHEVVLSEAEFFESLPKLIWHEDEPITWPSSIPLFFLSRLAGNRVKVVLTGEGSDELFGGYGRYRRYLADASAAVAYGRIPASLRRALRRVIAESPLLPADLRRKVQHTVLGRDPGIESLYLDNYCCAFSAAELQELMPHSKVVADQVYGRYLQRYKESDSSNLGRLLFADQHTYLVELLRKQDRMSMAASIESRVPFLDHRLVEYAAAVDASLKISGKEGKHVLKSAVEDLLPKRLIYRKKMGFPTPLKDWLRKGDSAKPVMRLLQRKGGFLSDYVDGRVLSPLLDRHERGQIDATDRIWRLLNLEIWSEVFLNGRAPEEVRLRS